MTEINRTLLTMAYKSCPSKFKFDERFTKNDLITDIFMNYKNCISLPACINEFQYLRNLTTNVAQQNHVNKLFCDGFLEPVLSRLRFLFTTFSHLDSEGYKYNNGINITRSLHEIELGHGLQFFGNAVVNHIPNKLLVWPHIFPLLCNSLKDVSVACRKYAMMIIYNCALGIPQHCEDIINQKELTIILLTLSITFDEECEWGLYLLELLLTFPGFIEECCSDVVSTNQRMSVLHLIHMNLTKEEASMIDFDGLFFLEKGFIIETEYILSPKDQDHPTEKFNQIMVVLDILCAATSAERYAEKMKAESPERRPTVLLCHTIALLKCVHLVTQAQPPPVKSTVEELCNVPSYNFQKSLITLIANLCFKNTVLQNKLREVDGIPLLMDCCKLNAKIPFITQWVIFAIHNICEENAENQKLISQMNKLGLGIEGADGDEHV